MTSLANVDGPRFVCDDDALYLLVQSSTCLEERAPAIDAALLLEAELFSGKSSSPIGLKGGRSSSSDSSLSKDEGIHLQEGLKAWSHERSRA